MSDDRRLEGLLPELEVVRKDFPILGRLVHGDKPLIYLDSAATSQKPRAVLDPFGQVTISRSFFRNSPDHVNTSDEVIVIGAVTSA